MIPIPVPPMSAEGGPRVLSSHDTDALRQAAIDLEASFLAEMLKSAGLDQTNDMFGGGAGEEQFDSFLREAQARELAMAGGIGLAESLFNALKARFDG